MSTPTEPQHAAIDVSEHAVVRYRERSRRALDLAAARAELAQLTARGEIGPVSPDWTRSASPMPFYLVVDDALALPLGAQHGRWIATTCLVKTPAPRRREQRSRGRARRALATLAGRRAAR